jgi:hypothetical protein
LTRSLSTQKKQRLQCFKLKHKGEGPVFFLCAQNLALLEKSPELTKKPLRIARFFCIWFEKGSKRYIRICFSFHILLIAKYGKIDLWIECNLSYITKLKKRKEKKYRA